MSNLTFLKVPAEVRDRFATAATTCRVVFERTATSWSAYAPALPGIGAAGATRAETERFAAEAIALHLERS